MRSILASLLAVLLLSGASLASACSLSCQLQLSCAPASSNHVASMGCEHCRHQHQTVVISSCRTMDCGPALVVTARADEDGSLLQPHMFVSVAVLDVPTLPHTVAFEGWRRNPPGKVSPFHPLLVALRV